MTIDEQITIVCVTYNSVSLLDALVLQLADRSNVIIVDNASHDQTVTLMREKLPQANYIVNAKNLGFGAANNQALRQVKTPFALLLNPDCHIDDAALMRLLSVAEQYPQAAVLAPQALHPGGVMQESYGPAFYLPQPRAYLLADGVVSAQWLSGCCLLLRVDCFPDRTAFDERFFLYYEDDDLTLDVIRRGFDCLLVPDAIAVHQGGGSSGLSWRTQLRKDFHHQRSKRLITEKYLGPVAAFKHRVKMFVGGLIAVPIYTLLLKRKYVIRWIGWFASALGAGHGRRQAH